MPAQFLGLVKVSLREWMLPLYQKSADTIATQIVGLSVLLFLVGMAALLTFPILKRFHELPRALQILGLLVLMLPFQICFLEGARPEIGAERARARWRWLARHALAISIAFCAACFLPLVVFFLFFD